MRSTLSIYRMDICDISRYCGYRDQESRFRKGGHFDEKQTYQTGFRVGRHRRAGVGSGRDGLSPGWREGTGQGRIRRQDFRILRMASPRRLQRYLEGSPQGAQGPEGFRQVWEASRSGDRKGNHRRRYRRLFPSRRPDFPRGCGGCFRQSFPAFLSRRRPRGEVRRCQVDQAPCQGRGECLAGSRVHVGQDGD